MQGENKTRRGQLKGYIFEVIIRKLLAKNGFIQISNNIPNKVKIHSTNNIEIKGRGTWHQIDCPCIYKKTIPFIYDIRLLCEMKFYSGEINKDKIRQYIGVIKEISENYFIDELNTLENQKKYTDIGLFFSANGFNTEAEKLAFVHGIKTISYKNNAPVQVIKESIILLERNYLSTQNCISKNNLTGFMDQLSNFIENPEDDKLRRIFESSFNPKSGYYNIILDLSNEVNNIHSSFFGVTETNYFLHFISKFKFPDELFYETDSRDCRIYYDRTSGNFHLTISGDNNRNRRFHFSAPIELIEKIFLKSSDIINEKERHFNKISVAIELNGIYRMLTLRIDRDWLHQIKAKEAIN